MWHTLSGRLPRMLTNSPKVMTIRKDVEEIIAGSCAVKILKCGGVVALPTDTIYGVACDATNASAIHKLYAIKRREENKPLAICLGETEEVNKWAIVDHLPRGLLQALLPGPVTLIFQTVNQYLDKSLVYHGKVGIRIPNCDFIRTVINELSKPLALTSANLSSQPSSVTIEEFKVLWDKLDGVFDGGNLSSSTITRSGSTIIDLSQRDVYTIVRPGMALENTCSILHSFKLSRTNN